MANELTVSFPSVPSTKELEPIVDQELEEFNRWFQDKGNAPLIGPEIAVLKTYLYYKYTEQKNGDQAGSSDPV